MTTPNEIPTPRTDAQAPHTPTPWAYCSMPSLGYIRPIAPGGCIVSFPPSAERSDQETIANARFIVDACNNYDRLCDDTDNLRAALRKCYALAQNMAVSEDTRRESIKTVVDDALGLDTEAKHQQLERYTNEDCATPRTDALIYLMDGIEEVVSASFARTLERETIAQAKRVEELEAALEYYASAPWVGHAGS